MEKTTIFFIVSSAAYTIILFLLLVFSLRKIRRLRKQLEDKSPVATVECVRELLQRMSKELTPGDFKHLILQANNLPMIKSRGEFDYMDTLKRVIYTNFQSVTISYPTKAN